MTADSDSLFQQVLDLLEEVSEPNSQGWHLALCVFHDDHKPSIRVRETGFVCFACGEKGGLRKLAEKLGIQVPKGRRNSREVGPGITLEEEVTAKGLDLDHVQNLGWFEATQNGRKVVRKPYYDVDGNTVAQRTRWALEQDNRFTWRSGDKVTPYGLNSLEDAKAAGYLIVQEGETDYARLTQAGIPAFGVPGATTWRSEWADYLEDISAVYLWQEPGSGGEALVQAVAKDLPQVRIIQAPPGAKDPCELGLSDQDHFVHRLHHLMAEATSWTEIQQEAAAKERQADYAKAKTLLEDPALLYKFGTAAEGAGLVGERVIALVMYLALKSRVTMRPVNLVIKGPSGSGKSWLVDTVIKFEPEGVVHTFTSHSERALIYSPRSFQNTFIYYQEASGLKQEDGIAAAVVRSIAAKGDIHYEVTVRDPDGSFTTQEIYKPGPVGIILTTVTPQLEEQLETRLLTLETKVEEEQSRAILTRIGLSMNGQQPLEDFSQWHALSRAIEGDDQVDVEFGEWLGQRVGIYGPRVHRDFESLLRLVQASTILYQHQRTRDTHRRILAQVADYAHIHTLLGTMFQSLQREGIAEEDRRLYEAVKELEKSGGA